MKKVVLALIVACLFLPFGLASNFTVTVQPNTINATQTTSLLFILDNLDATQNITEVNITLPSGFSYDSSTLTTTSGNCSWFSDQVIKCDGTPFILNGSETNVSFSVYASVASPPEYTFTFDAVDTNSTETQNTTNVTVNDVTYPKIESVYPANNTQVKYVPGKSYVFNASFSDNIALNSTEFFWNNIIEQTNYTTSKSFAVQIVKKDLGVGLYNFSWRVNDTSGNSNSTGTYFFNITKADNPMTMYLNGLKNQNITVVNGTNVNITIIAKGNISAYLDGNALTSSPQTDRYEAPHLFEQNGTYEVFANSTGNANYTSNTTGIKYWIKVIYPPARYKNLVFPAHTYSPGASYTFKITWYSPVAPVNNITNVSFVWQNTPHYLDVTNNSYATYSYTVKDLSAGSYSWKWCAKDTQGEENCTSGTFNVAKATPSLAIYGIKAYTAPVNISIVALGCPTKGASDVVCKLYKNDTLLSNTSYTFFADKPGTWVFVFNTSGGANYTSASVTGVITVSAPPTNISQPENTTNVTNVTNKTNVTQKTTTTTTTTLPATPPVLNETKVFSKVTTSSPAVFKIKQPGIFKVEEILVNVNKEASNVKIIVSPALNVKLSLPVPPNKGAVFTYLKIESNLQDTNIKQATIKFHVTKEWIKINNIDPNSVALYRWSNGWEKLETKKISEDSNYIHYQAVSPGLSYYAVAGEKKAGIPWTWIFIGVVVAVAIVIAYLFWPTETGKQYEYLKRKWSTPRLKFSL